MSDYSKNKSVTIKRENYGGELLGANVKIEEWPVPIRRYNITLPESTSKEKDDTIDK